MCSVIDRVNYGVGNSMLRKLENVRCPITRGGQAHTELLQFKKKPPSREDHPYSLRSRKSADHSYASRE